jgi:hypothetical protein
MRMLFEVAARALLLLLCTIQMSWLLVDDLDLQLSDPRKR